MISGPTANWAAQEVMVARQRWLREVVMRRCRQWRFRFVARQQGAAVAMEEPRRLAEQGKEVSRRWEWRMEGAAAVVAREREKSGQRLREKRWLRRRLWMVEAARGSGD